MPAAHRRARLPGTRSTLQKEVVMTALDGALFLMLFCGVAVFAMVVLLLILL
jgi:hypothetical protein